MSFGFSAGDTMTTLSLASRVARQLQLDQSVKDTNLKEILGHLEAILNKFVGLQVSNNTSNPQFYALIEVASQFRVSLERFISSGRSRIFDEAGVRETNAPGSTSNWSPKSIKTFSAEINGHLISLHLLKRANEDWMNNENLRYSSIVRDQFHLRDVRKCNVPVIDVICAFDQQHTIADRTMQIISTNLRIYTAVVNLHKGIPAQVQLSSPVTLNDACGRRAPFHLEFISSYEAFHEVLMLRFNNETSLQSAVRNEEFVLSSVKPYQITDLGDLKKTWRNGLKPGEAVDMSITILLGTKCLLCGSKIPFTELRNKTCDYCSTSYRLRSPLPLGNTATSKTTLPKTNKIDDISEPRLSRDLQEFIINFLSDEFSKFPEFSIWGPSAVDKWESAPFFNKFSELVRRFGSELLGLAGAEFEREVANTVSRRHLAITQSFRMLASGICSHDSHASSSAQEPKKKSLKAKRRASANSAIIGHENQIPMEQYTTSSIEKQAVVSFLTSGNALASLGQQIRTSLYFDFDPYSKFANVDAEFMDGLRTMNSFRDFDTERKYSATFKPFWQLQQFSHDELEGGTNFGPVITLSGSAVYARAIQCGTYIKENWGHTGLEILHAIESALSIENLRSEGLPSSSEALQVNGADSVASSSTMEINVEIYPRKGPDSKEFAMVNITSSLETLKKAGHCLTWLTAAIRVSPYNEMSYSDVTFKNCTYLAPFSSDPVFQNSMYFEIYAGDLLPLHKEEKKMCWNPLFPHSVIADGFPIPKRPEMPGLEISFDIMTCLSGVSYPINHNGGLVLQGLTTMLVPTRVDSGNSVQWHFMHKPKGSRVTLEDVDEDCKQRHKSGDLMDLRPLQENRAFLGWTKEAHVYLGTKDMNYSGIKGTQALRPEPKIQLAGFSLGAGSGGMGYGGPTAALNFTVGKRQRNEYSRGQDQELESKLVKTKAMPLILYDPEEKRAWLVSALSVILHLAHIYAHVWPELVKVKNHTVEMPYAKPSSDSGQAALDVILEHHKMPIYQSTLTEEPRYFINLIHELYSSLMEVIDKNKCREIPSESLFGGRSTVFGWELMSIISSPLGLLDKEHKLESTNGGWVHFAVGVPVLFCDGLGDLIRPCPDQNHLCKGWLTAPTGKDYLTATMSMLKILGDGCGYPNSCYKLGESVTWIQAADLFPDCRHEVGQTHKRCYRPLQRLKKLGGKERKKKTPDLLADRPPGCAVIFGKRSRRIPRLKVSLSKESDDESYGGQALTAAPHLMLPTLGHLRNDSGYSTGDVDPDSEHSEDDDEVDNTVPGTPSTVAHIDARDITLDAHVHVQGQTHAVESTGYRWPGGFLRLSWGLRRMMETIFVPAMVCCLVLLFAKTWIIKEECFSAL